MLCKFRVTVFKENKLWKKVVICPLSAKQCVAELLNQLFYHCLMPLAGMGYTKTILGMKCLFSDQPQYTFRLPPRFYHIYQQEN